MRLVFIYMVLLSRGQAKSSNAFAAVQCILSIVEVKYVVVWHAVKEVSGCVILPSNSVRVPT